MTNWIIAALVAYLVVILLIGFVAGRGASSFNERFYMANRKLTWWQDGLAVMTTAAPAAALTGTVGLFYTGGTNMLGYVLAYLLVSPFVYVMVGLRLRRIGQKFKFQTQADFAGRFYHSPFLHFFTSIGGLLFLIPYFAVNPIALGLVLSQTTPIPYSVGVGIFLIVTLAYSYFGGLRAIAQTDVFHGVMLILFFLVAMPVLVTAGGGMTHVLNTSTGPVNNPILFMTWVAYLGITPVVQADRCLRMYSVKDDQNIRRSALTIGATLGLAGLAFFILGISARAVVPGLSATAAQTSLSASLTKAASWMIPFYIVSLWGAGMSGLSSGMLSTANMFTKDLYIRIWKPEWLDFLKPNADRDRVTVRVGRIFMVAVAAFSAVIAGPQPSFIWTLINIMLAFFLQLFPMFFLGLYWKRVSRVAVTYSLVVGVALAIYWSFLAKPPFGFQAGLAALIVNSAIFVGLSLLTTDSEADVKERNAIRAVAELPVEIAPDDEAVPSEVVLGAD